MNKYSLLTSISAHFSDLCSVIPLKEHDDAFLTGSTDGFVKQWVPELNGSYKEVSKLFKAPGPVWSLCFIPGNLKYPTGIILAGSSDGKIYAFDMKKNELTFTLEAHTDAVCCLTSGLFGVFISGSFDNNAKIWLGEDCYSLLHGHEDAVLAAAFLKKDLILTGSADCTIRSWNSSKCENIFTGHSSAVTSLATSSEENFFSCSCDRTVRMWSSTGACLRVYNFNSKICGLAFIKNKDNFVVLCEDKIEIFSNYAHFQNITIPSHPLSITCTKNGTIAVGSCDGKLHLFEIHEEDKKLPVSNLVKKNSVMKELHSHSNKQTVQPQKEAELNVELTSKETVFKKTIAIIGAGIAGLSCALQLKELGFLEVKVFEGKKNIGGRIQTLNLGSNYIDMGAQWIHGESRNSVYEIAVKEDLVLKEAPSLMQHLFSFKNLRNKMQYVLVRQLLTFLEDKLDKIVEGPYSDNSIFSYLHYHFSEYCSNSDDELKELLTEVFNWFLRYLCELNGCCDLSNLSRSLYQCYEECDGEHAVEVKNGCSSIIRSLLKKLPIEWIVNNYTVETIDYVEFNAFHEKEEATSEVLCNNCLNCYPKIKLGFKEGATIVCDHVILTVSVGCLKRKKINFNPELEHDKLVAIDSIGFYVVNKIYLEFEDVFWKSPVNFNVLWKETYEEIFENSETELWKWKICWPKFIHRFAFSYGHPKMLTAWIVGEGAEYIEKLSDEEISYGCIKLLEIILQRNIPKPSQIIKSSWMSDPYTCGSYSFLSVENEVQSKYNCDLAKPIVSCQQHPVIQFAGEATHSYFFSTMHGAYDSGIREANRLNEHYMKNFYSSGSSSKAVGNITSIKNPRSFLKVVVIGAGLAGLTCAWNLHQKNFKEVVILEAQNVVGGRISSMNYGDSVLEMGASWLHGSDNPLYTFSSDHHLLCPPSDCPSHEGEGMFCTSNGSIVDVTIVEEIKEILNNIKAELGISNFRNKEDLKSAMEVFTSSFSSYMSNCNQSSDSDVKWGLFKWFVKYETVDNGCDSLSDVAVQSYTDWQECCEESYHINYKTGFQSVVDNLCTQIPKSFLNVNMPVKSVKWNDRFLLRAKKFYDMETKREFPILVQCEDGKCISADSVVITASVGFLKDNMDNFFSPNLPLIKQQAFERLGFGTINKIYLAFDEPFWNDSSHGFQLIWLDSMNNDCKKLLNENPWISGITGFDVVRNQPNVLVGWIGGIEAKQIEDVDDITLKDVCTKLLRMFLNKKEITSPKEIFRSYWFKNPYVRGAYSFRSNEFAQFRHSVEDFSPLYCMYTSVTGDTIEWPIVIFSGEATDQSAFSSTHGAFQSGLKAYQELDSACSKIEEDLKENYHNR